MTPESQDGVLLVTGATGYIGSWIVDIGLKRGYVVRLAVRNASKAGHVCKLHSEAHSLGRLQVVVVGDISRKCAFDEAVKGTHAIIHTASPVSLTAYEPSDIIDPAVNGAVGLLESAKLYAGSQLKRIVITSSCAAVTNIYNEPTTVSEDDWCQWAVDECNSKGSEASPLAKYRASKVLAEQAVWNFVEANKGKVSFDVTTLCPPWVFGPPIHEIPDITAVDPSWKQLARLLVTGRFKPASSAPGTTLLDAPLYGHGWVDVRDVAEAHVKALEASAAGNQRILVVAESFVWNDFLATGAELGGQCHDFKFAKPAVGEATRNVVWILQKERDILGLRFRAKDATITDLLAAFRERGWNKELEVF